MSILKTLVILSITQKAIFLIENVTRQICFQTPDVIFYLQDISQVCSADLRVFCGVEGNRCYPDKGKDTRFWVSPQHHPWGIVCLAVKHHLMWTWQSLWSCEERKQNKTKQNRILFNLSVIFCCGYTSEQDLQTKKRKHMTSNRKKVAELKQQKVNKGQKLILGQKPADTLNWTEIRFNYKSGLFPPWDIG